MIFQLLFQRFCGKQTVHHGIGREIIRKRQNDLIVADQTFTGSAVGDKLHLLWTDVQLFGKNITVAGSLIQHIYKVRVVEDVFHFGTGQQVLDILRNAGRNTAPFTKSLPDFSGIFRRLFFL